MSYVQDSIRGGKLQKSKRERLARTARLLVIQISVYDRGDNAKAITTCLLVLL